ncbi:hypothetical protein LDFHOB_05795 [Candidatus Electronema aureum]
MKKEQIISITEGIVNSDLTEEIEVFQIFSDSMYDAIKNNADEFNVGTRGYHGFGGDDSLISYFLLAFIASAAKEVAEVGVKITKDIIKIWYYKNKERIRSMTKNKKALNALELIEKYISS